MAIKIYGGEDTPLVQCINPKRNKWLVLWTIGYEESSSVFMAEEFNYKPSIQDVKDVILKWYNTQIEQSILSGFTWNDIPIWLSMENQFNYKVAYDIAVQSEGEILPTFKFGTDENPVYHKFETLDELRDFYSKASSYVIKTLSDGWSTKDEIDWTAYLTILE